MLSKTFQEKIIAILEQKNYKEIDGNLIVYPDSESNIIQIINAAKKFKFKIVVIGYGNTLDKEYSKIDNTLILSTLNLRKIINLDTENQFIRVESGIDFENLTQNLKKYDFYLPLTTGNEKRSLGGIYSSLKQYSIFSSFIMGVRFIDPLGNIIDYGCKTLKNVAGYNLADFMCGKFGEFGIIISLLLKVSPINRFYFEKEIVSDITIEKPKLLKDDKLYKEMKKNIDPFNIFI